MRARPPYTAEPCELYFRTMEYPLFYVSQLREDRIIMAPKRFFFFLPFKVSSGYGFHQVQKLSVWMSFFKQMLPGDCFIYYADDFTKVKII